MQRFIIYFLSIIIFLNFGDIFAKNDSIPKYRPRYGLFGGMNFNRHLFDVNSLSGNANEFPKSSRGDGVGMKFGISYESPIVDLLYWGFRASFTTLGAEFTNQRNGTVLLDGRSVLGELEENYKVDISTVGIAPIGVWNAFEGFSMFVGLRFAYVLQSDYSSTKRAVSPAGATLRGPDGMDSGMEELEVSSGSIPSANALNIAGIGGLSYDFRFGENGFLIVSPELFYSIGFSNVSENVSWNISAINIGVTFRYSPPVTLDEKRNVNIKTVEPDIPVTKEAPNKSDLFILKGKVFNARTKREAGGAELIIRDLKRNYDYGKIILADSSEKFAKRNLGAGKWEIEAQSSNGKKFEFTISDKGNYSLISTNANENGEFFIELPKGTKFKVLAQGENLFYEEKIIENAGREIFETDFYVPEKITLRINFPTGEYESPYPFTLDENGKKSDVRWKDALDKLAENILLSKDKLKKIILVGHTDGIGEEEENKTLGLRRVNFIIERLVMRGVPRELLEGRSKGETEKLRARSGELVEDYRKRLRRVEISKIIEE